MKRNFYTLLITVCLNTWMLSACSMPLRPTPQTDMAANIYTQLAHHYWQQGYKDIALDRLTLALQQKPDYAPAMELMQQIHAEAAN